MYKFKTNEIRKIQNLIDDLEIKIQRTVHGKTFEDYTFKDGYISTETIDNLRNKLEKLLITLDNQLFNEYDDGK